VALRWLRQGAGVDTAIRLVANYALYAVALGALLTWLRVPRPEKVPLAVAAVVAVLLVAVGVKVAGIVWTDPRPFVVDHTAPLIPHPADNGFPSDHTALATAVAAVVLLWHRRAGALLLALAVLLGAARVGAHVHHWPDIIAGFAIGIVCAALARLVAQWAVPRFSRARAGQRRTV
jgi:undecaprenyl-diphosphatase